MRTEIPFYQIDAFTDRPFAGNPAAVCPLQTWLPDALMQAIATENNLSETAFFVGEQEDFRIRWFTPSVEVDLCGHATLASAFVLFNELQPGREQVTFVSRSGQLPVRREGQGLVMDFPASVPRPLAPPPGLAGALGAMPTGAVSGGRGIIAVFDDAATVRGLRPDMAAIAALDTFAVAATAPGGGADGDVAFVSRFFAPAAGIPEDPVTGSLHCSLAPYWAERLGRNRLRARQVSARGGEIDCELRGDRVHLGGSAVLIIKGSLRVA